MCNVPKSQRDIDEPRDWNNLTRLARDVGATWILYLDADEMVSKDVVGLLPDLMRRTVADVVQFPKITPWFSFDKYRKDLPRFYHAADKVLNPILVRLTDNLMWDNNRGGRAKLFAKKLFRGEPRLPNYGRVFPHGVDKHSLRLDDFPSMHYSFLDYNKILRKQIFYAIREREVRPDKPREEIINFASRPLIRGKQQFERIDSKHLWEDYLHLITIDRCEDES